MKSPIFWLLLGLFAPLTSLACEDWKTVPAEFDEDRIYVVVEDSRGKHRFLLGEGDYGPAFFGTRTWQFDYSGRQLRYVDVALEGSHADDLVPMSFRMKDGARTSNQPLFPITVEGDTLRMLFEPGASSFIRRSVFESWRKAHPEWRVIADLIEVPRVRVGAHDVGPVWFASRADEVYDEYGLEITDGHTDGAVGGNILRYFRVTADYLRGTLLFELPR